MTAEKMKATKATLRKNKFGTGDFGYRDAEEILDSGIRVYWYTDTRSHPHLMLAQDEEEAKSWIMEKVGAIVEDPYPFLEGCLVSKRSKRKWFAESPAGTKAKGKRRDHVEHRLTVLTMLEMSSEQQQEVAK